MTKKNTTGLIGCWILLTCFPLSAAENTPRAFINGEGPGWVALGEKDFADVNGNEDTWKFEDNLIKSTGVPVGVMRTAKQYKNLEMVLEWRHLKEAGNSGVFAWVMEKSLTDLKPGQLPRSGIEIQPCGTTRSPEAGWVGGAGDGVAEGLVNSRRGGRGAGDHRDLD